MHCVGLSIYLFIYLSLDNLDPDMYASIYLSIILSVSPYIWS